MKDWTAEINAVLSPPQALLRYTAMLDDLLKTIEQHDELSYGATVALVVKRATVLADKGDIEPLRQTLKEITGNDLTRYLKLPDLGRGKKFPKSTPVLRAARDIKILRAYYKGKKYRPTGDDIVKIAAARHKADVDQVLNRLKKPL
jgi:hypothetical protein